MELVKVYNEGHMGIIHPESKVAHKYLDGLRGIEIGAASYAPFGIPGTLNVSTGDPADREIYKNIQLAVCGSYATVDIEAEADRIPLDTHSQDFVIASHVLEHTPNPINCLLEWRRLLKKDGYVFLIVPKREGPYGDYYRRITPLQDFITAYENNWTDQQTYDLIWDRPDKAFDRPRGHYWVFNLASLLHLISWCNAEINISSQHFDYNYALRWKLLEAHETDDCDETGHMAVYKQW